MHLIARTAVVAVLLWPAALAADDSGSSFIKEAIQGNLAEVSMGKLAQQKATSPAVRDYGQMLVADHGKANEKARAAAKSAGADIPTEPTSKQKTEAKDLGKLTGAKFDKDFMQHMVKDHKKDVAAYEKQASSGTGPVTEYAKETLPTLKRHLERAQSIASELGS